MAIDHDLHQYSAEAAVLTTTSSCEFRSLAYLSVYPFGPRFLLFTVRNTLLALAMSTSAVMPFRFRAQTPIFFIFHPEMNEARSTKHVVVTTD